MPATLQWARRLAPVLFILGLLVGLQIDHDHLKQGFDHWIGQYIPNMQLLFPARKHGLVGAVMVVAALLLSPWLQRRFTHPWLNSLGRQSYSVYGVHEVLIYTFACWVLMALVPFQAPTTWDILPHAGSYHLSVLVTFIAYITVVWMVSLTMTALVDEPCIRLAQRIAKWITGRGGNNNNNSSSSSGRNMPLTTERPAEPSSMTIMSGTVGSPER
jgi:peptidoglycan/LPS O-acetylase OafA/YrhL